MQTTTQIDFDIIVTKINDFNKAWNEKDLSKMAAFMSHDVIFTNPSIKVGFFKIPGKKLEGIFNVLKYSETFFKKFKSIKEEKVILNITHKDGIYLVECDSHNHTFNTSSQLSLQLDQDYIIRKIAYTNVRKFKNQKDVSVISFLLNQVKNKFLN